MRVAVNSNREQWQRTAAEDRAAGEEEKKEKEKE